MNENVDIQRYRQKIKDNELRFKSEIESHRRNDTPVDVVIAEINENFEKVRQRHIKIRGRIFEYGGEN
jgi:hypothetical protein